MIKELLHCCICVIYIPLLCCQYHYIYQASIFLNLSGNFYNCCETAFSFLFCHLQINILKVADGNNEKQHTAQFISTKHLQWFKITMTAIPIEVTNVDIYMTDFNLYTFCKMINTSQLIITKAYRSKEIHNNHTYTKWLQHIYCLIFNRTKRNIFAQSHCWKKYVKLIIPNPRK